MDRAYLGVALLVTVFAGLMLADVSPGGLFQAETGNVAVTGLQVAPNPVPAGSTATVTVTIHNPGSTGVENIAVVLFDDETRVNTRTVDTLAAGDTHRLTFSYEDASPVGVHRFEAVATTGMVHPEPGGTGENRYRETVRVVPPSYYGE